MFSIIIRFVTSQENLQADDIESVNKMTEALKLFPANIVRYEVLDKDLVTVEEWESPYWS